MPRNLVMYGAAVIAGLVGYFIFRELLGGGLMLIVSVVALIFCGVVIVRNLQTNRKVADATVAQRTEALTFTAAPGKAALYVMRNQFVGQAVGVNVMVDGREVAQIKSPRFTRLVVAPGLHRIAGYTGTNKKPADGEGLELNAAAGDVLVVKCEVEAQMLGVTVKFTPLSLDTARTELPKISRMVLPDVAEL